MSTLTRPPQEVIAEGEMMRSAGKRMLVVEGGSDLSFLSQHVDTRRVALVAGHGRKACESIAECMDDVFESKTGEEWIRVLVDRDGHGVANQSTYLISTVGRDLDSEILAMPGILRKVVHGVHRLSSSEDAEAVLTDIVAAALRMRWVRDLNESEALGLKLRRLESAAKCSGGYKSITIQRLLEGVPLCESQIAEFREPELEGPDEAAARAAHCVGHDLHLLISLFRESEFASHRNAMTPDAVQTAAYLAISRDMVLQMPTIALLLKWTPCIIATTPVYAKAG